MNIFTIEHGEFLNNFYEQVRQYADSLLDEINKLITHDKNNYFKTFFTPEEIGILIILNNAFFQNINGFYEMIECRLPIPGFNALRAAIEAVRLIREYFINKEFREEYIHNKNTDFQNSPDYAFMQRKINQRLEAEEIAIKRKYPNIGFLRYSNYDLTKGSPLANLHSELSKWSHLLNVNLIIPPQIDCNRIYLGINNDYTDRMQYILKKYIEGSYFILSHQYETFSVAKFSLEFLQKNIDMGELHGKYIDVIYKDKSEKNEK